MQISYFYALCIITKQSFYPFQVWQDCVVRITEKTATIFRIVRLRANGTMHACAVLISWLKPAMLQFRLNLSAEFNRNPLFVDLI